MQSISYGKEIEKSIRRRLEKIFISIDKDESINSSKLPAVNGKRVEFIKSYKINGYEFAKKQINSKFEREIFDDIILNEWIQDEKEKDSAMDENEDAR